MSSTSPLLTYGGGRKTAKKHKKYLVDSVAANSTLASDAAASPLSKADLQAGSKTKGRRYPGAVPDTKVVRTYDDAIRRRDFQQVLWMITNGDVAADHETASGENAILAAISAKQADVVAMLISRCDSNTVFSHNGLFASMHSSDAFCMFAHCFVSGVSIDSANQKGYTPLMKAIAAASPFAEASTVPPPPKKSLKRALHLHEPISTRSKSNQLSNRNDLLPDFERFDNDIVKTVLDYKPDVMKRDALGKTALDWAKCTGNIPALKMVEVHQQANSLHHAATSNRDQRIAESLALLQRHDECVMSVESYLAKHSFDEKEFVRFLTVSHSRMPWEEFCASVADLNMARVQIPSAFEDPTTAFFVNHETRQGWTPLTKCASNGYLEAVQVLLGMGAKMHHETRLRHTAMTWACYCGHEAVVLHLLRAGVDLDQKTREGKTALIHAASNSQSKVVHHLLLALREKSLPSKAKDAFDSDLTLLNRRKSMQSAWKRTNSSDTPKENRVEWHETFCSSLCWKDQSGKSALDYAEQFAPDVATGDGEQDPQLEHAATATVLQQLKNALSDARNHLQYVAKNEARTRKIKCKFPGCHFVAPRDTMPVHEQHQCLMRTIHCDHCGEGIVFETRQKHEQSDCEMRKVACVNFQFGCQEHILFKDLDAHAANHCRKRCMECRLLCGKVLPFDEAFTHESTQCSLRTIECALGCSATFLAKESGNHYRKYCPKRLMPCVGEKQRNSASSGCGIQVVADDMAFHLAHLCEKRKLSCKWAINGCEEAIGGSAESRNHHEQRECLFRPMACRNNCELSGDILACFLPEHYAWQCMLERKPCPNRCQAGVAGNDGVLFPAHLLDVHVLEDAGDCAKRMARCPLDLCGKKINLLDAHEKESFDLLMSGDVGLSRLEKRNVSLRAVRKRVQRSSQFLDRLRASEADCDVHVSERWELLTRSATKQFLVTWLTQLHEHLERDLESVEAGKTARSVRCRVLTYSQPDGKHLLEFPDGHSEWVSLHLREYETLLPPPSNGDQQPVHPSAHFQCPFLEAGQRATHAEHECHLRLLPCPLACGQRLPSHGIAAHISKRCNLRNAPCRLGCGSVMPYLSLGEHEDQECALRSVFCEHCHESIRWQALAKHLEKRCPKLPRRCRLGCAKQVSWSETSVHEASECPKRLIKCEQCEKSIWFCERHVHDEDECPLRVYGKCDAKCGETLTFNEVGHHLLFNCSQRVVTCSQCDQRLVFARLQEHKSLQCPQRLLHCRRGCGHVVKEIDAETHEEEECSKRLVHCSNKCGLQTPSCGLDEHLELSCEMRVIECPSGCQERLFAYQYEAHWKRCRQRVFPCGTGAKACARPIRLWFADRKLVRCATHQENALLWALKCQDEDLVTYFLQNVAPATALHDEFANGFSPLSMAVSLGNIEIVKVLLRFGADVNLETSRGRTPLAEACIAQNTELVALLIENRANVSHTNRHGRNLMAMVRALAAAASPSDTTTHDKWSEIAKLLEEREAMERDQRELFMAIASSNYDYMANFLKFSPNSDQSNQLEIFQDSLREQEKMVELAKLEHAEAIRVFNESVADVEAKSERVTHLSKQVEDCTSQIKRVDHFHDTAVADSNALEADMLTLIREITAQNIAQLLNVHVPPENYFVVMKAICMISGVLPRGRRNAAEYTDMEWWKAAQALLMDRTLLQRLRGYKKRGITPDVMAKVRRECMNTPAFAASTVSFQSLSSSGDEDTTSISAEESQPPKLPPVETLRGDIVSLLATWVKGVEMEYKSRSERQTLGERKRRLAICLSGTQDTLFQTEFDMQVATRSLPARQEEVEEARAKAADEEKELFAAQQRLKTYKILNLAALNGHTPLTFASAVGNEAMVHMLLSHGASAGYAEEEQHLCASFIQLIIRDHLQKRRQKRNEANHPQIVVQTRSDEAIDSLVRNVAFTFLLSHYRRKIAFYRQTHRVALHEAIFNGFPQIVEILLANEAKLWQKTHVLPLRTFPGASEESGSQHPKLQLPGGWKLTPLMDRTDKRNGSAASNSGTREPMTSKETLDLAILKYDCATYRPGKGWDPTMTHYDGTRAFVTAAIAKVEHALQQRRNEIAARKSVVKKAAERRVLHAALEKAILARDFHAVAQLLDQGAYADYETSHNGRSALMAACLDEAYVENPDTRDVLAVEFLLDRPRNRPYVNFESSSGHTALSTAASHGTLLCAQILVDRGATVNLASRLHGQTALMVAAANGKTEFVRFLIQQPDIDVFVQDKQGKTAFLHAQENGVADAMHLLGAAMVGNRGRFYSSVSALYGVCKWGCGFMTNIEDHVVQKSVVVKNTHPLAHHESHTCPKRHVVCPNQCGRADLWAESLAEHVREDCRARVVTCKQPKCGATFTFEHLQTHDREECEFRMIHCECDEQMTYQKHVVHVQNRCPMRLVSCPLGCGDSSTKFRFLDLKPHQRNECPNRRVRCRNGCSANGLLFKQRGHHEDHLCALRRVHCKWGCEETVIAKSQQYHESEECLKRQLPCPNKCGLMNVEFLDVEHHVTETCARRVVSCSAGCGRKVPLHIMENHVHKECRKRMVTCELCSQQLVEDDKFAHQSSSCSQRISLCGLCGQTNIPYAQLAVHRSETCRMRQVTCKYNCFVKLLLAHEKERHESCECAFRPMWCPLGCRDVIIANAAKKHERVCAMRFVTCSLGCGTELREKDRLEHERAFCSGSMRSSHSRQRRS